MQNQFQNPAFLAMFNKSATVGLTVRGQDRSDKLDSNSLTPFWEDNEPFLVQPAPEEHSPFILDDTPVYSKVDQLRFTRMFLVENSWIREIRPSHTPTAHMIYNITKRIFDLLVVGILLVPLGLVFLLCALLIKIESPNGPVLFVQQRTGRGGKRFGMYKFRTMVPNAEELKKELAHLNELEWPDFKITNDPRVTRIGRFLRKTSLDELPQLINILKGEMSIVGPRPTSFEPHTYDLWQTQRLDVVPGLTGLWQMIGRGETEFIERVYIDILYIQRRCMMLDIQIIVRTAVSIIKQKGRF